MIVYGKQTVFYILENHPKIIKQIFLTKDIDKKLFKKFMDVGAKIVRPDNMKAQSMAKGGNHQGFLLQIDEFEFADLKETKKGEFIVVLDGLSDVGNIGAIVRSCYALGVDSVVVCGLKNFNPAPVIRTSSGAMLDMPVCVTHSSYDLANELKQVGFSLVGADMEGYEVASIERQSNQKIALFLGSESEGLSNKLKKKLDLKVSIGMKNNFDSLNVSVAAGILIYQLK
ncbi:MAG: 23S rRNA (guanosine(2251)-2'-O)-methyltransferase RlmB [Campylobacterota bacterium]|nr:23S rRNA (guanosine(2251)-2'-O)-methyltransferase RlmB [Campylobacterota bacterium]